MRISMTREEVAEAVRAKVALDSGGLLAAEKITFHERGGATIDLQATEARMAEAAAQLDTEQGAE